MTVKHLVELLRDGKGVFGIIDHGDDDHEPRELILRPDKLVGVPRCFQKPIYQQICGGFRHGMFMRTAEEQFRQSIHRPMLRRAGLDWPPTDQPWWSDDKKQQDRNRQTYHGLRLGSLSVLNSLIRTALAEAADQDALKMARRFPFKGRENVYTASARSRRALQLYEVFPVLGLAIYSREEGTDPERVAAVTAVERGRSLSHIAGLMGVPMALRRVKPGAAALVFVPDYFRERVCYIFRAEPDLIHAWLPDSQRKMKLWLRAVSFAAGVDPDFATWTARHVFDLGSTFDAIEFRLRDLMDWVRACSSTDEFDFFEAENGTADDGKQGRKLELPELVPWHEPVDGEALVSRLEHAITQYVVLTDHEALACALWVLHAHAHDWFFISPTLRISSPEKQCGKSTLLNVLGPMVPRHLPTENASAASLFRVKAPAPLPDDLLKRLRRHKAGVIEHLARARILNGVEALLSSTGRWDTDRGLAAVRHFLQEHWTAAHGAGWTDEELFACYPDLNIAGVRYDYAGPGTASASSGTPIDRVTASQVVFQNNLVHRKRPLPADAVPVWELE